MKHLIWGLLFVIFVSGCGNKQKRIEEQQRLDSIAKIEKAVLDSIEEKRADSLALIAWGDAKFGMTMEEALKTNAFKDYSSNVSDTELGQKLSLSIEKLEIGNYNIDVLQFNVFFRNNELCDILIKSYPQPADHIDDLVNDALVIANQFYKNKAGGSSQFVDFERHTYDSGS